MKGNGGLRQLKDIALILQKEEYQPIWLKFGELAVTLTSFAVSDGILFHIFSFIGSLKQREVFLLLAGKGIMAAVFHLLTGSVGSPLCLRACCSCRTKSLLMAVSFMLSLNIRI